MASKYKLLFSCVLLALVTTAHSQKMTEASFNVQVYPTGIITQLALDKAVGEQSFIGLRAGSNVFQHRDLGVHDDEKGQGFGFTPSYTYYFNKNRKQWNISVKNDVWWSSVDWYDMVNNEMIEGSSEIVVLQPTVDIGYSFIVGDSFVLVPSLAGGWEWNVKTTGEPTGEGPIILVALKIGKRF